MPIQLFHMPGGPFAERCLLALRLKGLSFEPVMLDPARGDTKTAEFQAISPRGTLPVLKDGVVTVRESQAIVFYLDAAYPAPPLYGRTPQETASVMQEICDQASYLEPLLKRIIGAQHLTAEAKPGPEELLPALPNELRRLDERLATQAWVAGEILSAADVNIYPLMSRLEPALRHLDAALASSCREAWRSCPNIHRWLQDFGDVSG